MAQHDDPHTDVHPRTAVLTRGFDPSLSVGSARPAVFRSSTYVFATPEAAERAFAMAHGKIRHQEGERPDLIYSRISHPNAEILEDQIVPLEAGARDAAVFNSGMAAIMTAFFTFARPHGTIVYSTPLYGGTTGLIHEFLEPFGVNGIPVPSGDGPAIEHAIKSAKNCCIVYLETPANPTLTMTDIERVADAAARHPDKPVVMVDNTFLGPTFQHPLHLGADLVLYSATKFLSGFSDMIAGVALARNREHIEMLRARRVMFGNILQPDECWMLDGRLPTVALRMNRQSKNGQRLAEALHGHKELSRVIYPTLFEDPEQIRIFRKQCAYPGALFSIEFKGGKKAAFDFLRRVRIARNAVSLGGVETLTCHPKTTTHSGMSPEELAESGVTDGLVRISVGIEDWRDLLADFEQALAE
ncbi:MAG TPA: aminotransferase class I/II-fold pyridoxal phosphate-dependent enzyme [Bryobacteraceae bacterium]|nr:aminotransferase class I/II-fold pyridoxal phosphate-dependent enzyme [Bryobacteraceae bacterium]